MFKELRNIKKDKKTMTVTYTCPWPGPCLGHKFKKELRLKHTGEGTNAMVRIHPATKIRCPECQRGIPKMSYE